MRVAAAGGDLGCITSAAERQALVREAARWAWQGYKCGPLAAACAPLQCLLPLACWPQACFPQLLW